MLYVRPQISTKSMYGLAIQGARNEYHGHPRDPQGYLSMRLVRMLIHQDFHPKAIHKKIGLIRPKFCNMFDSPCCYTTPGPEAI